MRIGIEAQRIFRAKKHGMEVVAIEIIKQLQQLDKINEYVIFARPDADDAGIKETDNFKISRINSFTYADWEQFNLPWNARRHHLDFLHCTCNTGPIFSGIPMMLTLHDIIYLESVSFKGTSYQNFGNLYRRFVVPRVVRKSKFVVTVSQFEKNTILERLRLPDDRVEVVYNAVNPRFNNHFSKEEVKRFRTARQLPEKFILFLGNTAPKKNTENVIRAFVEFCHNDDSQVPLVLLDYDRMLVEKMLAEMKETALMSRFVFPGYIAPDQMPLMYNAATLFLYPSLRESFGLPILEAMACGVPVITSITSSMPEVAGDAALLIDPYNHHALAEGMYKVLSDDKLQKQYSDAGLERAKSFTWEAAARKLLTIYGRM